MKKNFKERAQELKENKLVINPVQVLSEEFDIGKRTIQNWLVECGISFADRRSEYQDAIRRLVYSVTETVSIEKKPPVYHWDDWIITSDYHVPYHNPELVLKMLRLAAKFDIKNLVIIGDFQDFNPLFFKPTGFRAGELEFEINAIRTIIEVLTSWFDEVVWTMGNHENRLRLLIERLCKSDSKVEELIKQLVGTEYGSIFSALYSNPKLHIYDSPVCKIVNRTGEWHLSHPANYSRIAPQNERRLAGKHLCHVIGTHGHLYADGFHESGKFRTMQIGGMFDPEKLDYLFERDTNHPKVQPGFAMMMKGVVYGFPDHPACTDWDWWLK